MLKMRQVLLALCTVCALLSAASALNCNSCVPTVSGTCTDTTMTCPASQPQCAVAAVSVNVAGTKKTINMKSCSEPEACNGPISLNFGIQRTTINAKCCTTDLCNTGSVPAYADSTPSGLECYGCIGQDCRDTMKCLGVEDRCLKVVVEAQGSKIVTKGCASKNVCVSQSMQIPGLSGSIYCCEGKLCNGARRVGQNIPLLLLPLLTFKLLF
ncbi:urokinase plasminogen activator surface receptor-like [Acipenser ruthenus]|uniref:urokinase plasminogen activator surface receptor-like n=1 Tax=Acipenser ruthenus TaxID=7906 RepID=UPI002742056F|nr:urokinase plasminogen activator surface receptor-like [Acipenser ruthenus]